MKVMKAGDTTTGVGRGPVSIGRSSRTLGADLPERTARPRAVAPYVSQTLTNEFIKGAVISPSLRQGPATTFDGAAGNIVLFGGATIAGGDSAFRRHLDLGRNRQATHAVVLFGGVTTNLTNLDDTRMWDGSNWRQIHPANRLPRARNVANMEYDAVTGAC
jgi:hypothetical protein